MYKKRSIVIHGSTLVCFLKVPWFIYFRIMHILYVNVIGDPHVAPRSRWKSELMVCAPCNGLVMWMSNFIFQSNIAREKKNTISPGCLWRCLLAYLLCLLSWIIKVISSQRVFFPYCMRFLHCCASYIIIRVIPIHNMFRLTIQEL